MRKYIETGPDRLLELVQKKGKVSVQEVAAVLKVSKELVEEWAVILDKKGLIKIDYGVTKMTLRKV
jgi:Mn-dependent DtxR family transcriptional regulator